MNIRNKIDRSIRERIWQEDNFKWNRKVLDGVEQHVSDALISLDIITDEQFEKQLEDE